MRRFFVRVLNPFGPYRPGDEVCLDEETYERSKAHVTLTATETDGKLEPVGEPKAKAKAKD